MTTPQDQIIPAAVGHSVIRFTFLDRKVNPDFVASGEALEIRPIVAWRIVEGIVLPVALGLSDQPADGCEAIIIPGGMIYDVSGRSWRSLAAWSQDVAKAWRAWREAHFPQPAPAPHPLQHLEGAIISVPH